MDWRLLIDDNQIEEINSFSFDPSIRGVLVFKHSSRCSISSLALSRFERSWKLSQQIPLYFLDILKYRAISNKIAEKYSVSHESPQVLIISKGKCIYDASHNNIRAEAISTLF